MCGHAHIPRLVTSDKARFAPSGEERSGGERSGAGEDKSYQVREAIWQQREFQTSSDGRTERETMHHIVDSYAFYKIEADHKQATGSSSNS